MVLAHDAALHECEVASAHLALGLGLGVRVRVWVWVRVRVRVRLRVSAVRGEDAAAKAHVVGSDPLLVRVRVRVGGLEPSLELSFKACLQQGHRVKWR